MEKKKNSWLSKVSYSVQSKGLEVVNSIPEMSEKFITNVLPTTTVKQDCKNVLRLTRVQGIPAMRRRVLDGFPVDYQKSGLSKDDFLKQFRDEPKFEEVLKKLNLTWAEIEGAL